MLVSAALIGVGWRGRYLSHMFTPTFWRIWNMPIGFIYFYKLCFQNIGILEKLDNSALFLGFFLSIVFVWHFRRGFQSCWKILLIAPARSGLFVLYNIFGVSSIFNGSLTAWPLAWKLFYGILLVTQFPVTSGAPNF